MIPILSSYKGRLGQPLLQAGKLHTKQVVINRMTGTFWGNRIGKCRSMFWYEDIPVSETFADLRSNTVLSREISGDSDSFHPPHLIHCLLSSTKQPSSLGHLCASLSTVLTSPHRAALSLHRFLFLLLPGARNVSPGVSETQGNFTQPHHWIPWGEFLRKFSRLKLRFQGKYRWPHSHMRTHTPALGRLLTCISSFEWRNPSTAQLWLWSLFGYCPNLNCLSTWNFMCLIGLKDYFSILSTSGEVYD